MWVIQASPPLLGWQELLGFAEKLSGALIAFLFFIGLSRGWWTMKTEVDEIRKDRDYWQRKAELLEERNASKIRPKE